MRILLDYRPALRARTGVGEYVHELTRAMAALGHGDEISVLTSSWKDRPPPLLASELKGVHIVDRRVPVRPLTWAWHRLGWPPVEWLAGEVDVVHAQTPLLIPARRAAQVITIHDLDFLHHPERAEAEMQRDYPVLVANHARRADHVVVSSHHAAREVIAHLEVPPGKITVCSPGAPDWAHTIARERASAPSTPGPSGTVGPILFVGTIEPRKNVPTLLDAYELLLQRHPDAPRLVLAGRVRSEMQPLVDRVKAGPLARHVSMLGYVSEEQRRSLYRDACMLVLPSLEEGFGLPVLEAMACGVPVVISNRGALPEVADDAASPVDPMDTDALTREMARVLRPEVAIEAAARGIARAARYSWESCAMSAREAYRAAVAARERRLQ